MQIYVKKTEQIIKDGALSEYASAEKFADRQSADVKFFKALSDVSADIGKNHTFMHIAIEDSVGNTLKVENIGHYLEKLPTNAE